MCTTFGLLTIGISVRIQLYSHLVRIWKNVMPSLRPRKVSSIVEGGPSEVSVTIVVEKISCPAQDDQSEVKVEHGAEEMNPAALEMV